ncbi:hypothetical protein FOMPIDRAFT_10519, partial [Fomitopsis schrenkii]
VHVYTDGSAIPVTTGQAHGGAGVYWGPNSPRNMALSVPMPVTNNRAELFAVLHALLVASPYQPLRIHTDSEYAIRSICHWAPKNAALGWTCANADMLQNIVDVLRTRPAAVSFAWVKGHAGNAHNEEADRLAREGA